MLQNAVARYNSYHDQFSYTNQNVQVADNSSYNQDKWAGCMSIPSLCAGTSSGPRLGVALSLHTIVKFGVYIAIYTS